MPIVQVVHKSAILIQSVLSWSLFVFRTMLCIYMYIFCCVLFLHVMYLKVQKFCRHCAYDCDNYHILLFLCFTGWRLPFVFTFHIQGCHVLHNFSILIGKLQSHDDFAVYFGQINLSPSTVLYGFHTQILKFVSKYAQQMWKLVADISFCGLASLRTVKSLI